MVGGSDVGIIIEGSIIFSGVARQGALGARAPPRVSSRNFTLGGKLTNCMAISHGEGEGVGGDLPPPARSA